MGPKSVPLVVRHKIKMRYESVHDRVHLFCPGGEFILFHPCRLPTFTLMHGVDVLFAHE